MNIFLRDSKKNFVISRNIFNYPFKKDLIHQVINSYNTKNRKGTKAQKNRSEVSGSGKKPWRQKGTGRARVGSIRSPIWRSGGVTFAAKNKIYKIKINRKMYKNSIKSILSELIRLNRIFFFKKFFIDFPKTKILVRKLKELNLKNVLIIVNKITKNLLFSSKNLNLVKVIETKSINPRELLKFKQIVITSKALKKIEEILE